MKQFLLRRITWACTLTVAFLMQALPARGDEAHDKILPSTVWVVVAQDAQKSMCGTGCLVDRERRLLITCLHLVKEQTEATVFFPMIVDNATQIEAKDYLEHRTGVKARVVATDVARDMAVLRLERLPDDVPAPAAVLAENAPAPEEPVFGVGNSGNDQKPLDQASLWKRYESAVNRRSYTEQQMKDGVGAMNAWVIELNDPIAPGDSGGPLVDAKGRLVGMVYGFAEDKGFALDVEEIRMVLERVRKPAPLTGQWTAKCTDKDKQGRFFKINLLADGTLEWISDRKHVGRFELQQERMTWVVPSLNINETFTIVRNGESSFSFLSNGVPIRLVRR